MMNLKISRILNLRKGKVERRKDQARKQVRGRQR